MACTDFGNLQDIGKKYIFTAMVEAFDSKPHLTPVVGFGPVQRSREAAAQNDAAFRAAMKTLVIGAGVLSTGILLGKSLNFLASKTSREKNSQ